MMRATSIRQILGKVDEELLLEPFGVAVLILTILTLAALLLPVTSFAQVPDGCVRVFAAGIKNSSGVLLASGTITFAPVSASGMPMSYLSLCGWNGV